MAVGLEESLVAQLVERLHRAHVVVQIACVHLLDELLQRVAHIELIGLLGRNDHHVSCGRKACHFFVVVFDLFSNRICLSLRTTSKVNAIFMLLCYDQCSRGLTVEGKKQKAFSTHNSIKRNKYGNCCEHCDTATKIATRIYLFVVLVFFARIDKKTEYECCVCVCVCKCVCV